MIKRVKIVERNKKDKKSVTVRTGLINKYANARINLCNKLKYGKVIYYFKLLRKFPAF